MAILIGLCWKAMTAVVAVVLVRAFLIWFDKTKYRTDFKEKTLDKATPDARLRYYGNRLLGICILVAAVLF